MILLSAALFWMGAFGIVGLLSSENRNRLTWVIGCSAALAGGILITASIQSFGIPIAWPMMSFWGWASCVCTGFFAWQIANYLREQVSEDRIRYGIRSASWGLIAIFLWAKWLASPPALTWATGVAPFSLPICTVFVGFCILAGMAIRAARSQRSHSVQTDKLVHVSLILGSIVFAIPLLWMLLTSLREDALIGANDTPSWLPLVSVTAQYDDPNDPLFQFYDNGTRVLARLDKTLDDGQLSLVIESPPRLRGTPTIRKSIDVSRVPREVPMVQLYRNDVDIRGIVIATLNDGRQKLQVLSPPDLKGTEILVAPTELKAVTKIGLRYRNYVDAFESLPPSSFYGWSFLRNTLWLIILTTVGTLLSSSLIAYAFARLRFPGKSMMFRVLLSTMMLPGAVTLLPTFLIFRWLGWIDTLYPLWVPAFLGGAFNVFLLRQFFMTIPSELEDAAKIDGCNPWATYRRIMLPLIKPAMVCIGVWTFMGAWGNFMGPLIYLNTIDKMPIAYALQLYSLDKGGEPGLMMAMSTVAMLPILILFFFAQRYFIEGVSLSGLGGR